MENGSKSIGVVDYGRGNLRSVCKALEAVGASVSLVTEAAQLDRFDAIVVPGVGAFGDCAENLRASGLWEPLREWLQAGRPYLGICLGYQLLFESSEESPGSKGLGFLPGRVVRFRGDNLKIPHIGWNRLRETRSPIYKSLAMDPYFYFVHSYFPVPARRRHRQRALRIRRIIRREHQPRQHACHAISSGKKPIRRAHFVKKFSRDARIGTPSLRLAAICYCFLRST